MANEGPRSQTSAVIGGGDLAAMALGVDRLGQSGHLENQRRELGHRTQTKKSLKGGVMPTGVISDKGDDRCLLGGSAPLEPATVAKAWGKRRIALKLTSRTVLS